MSSPTYEEICSIAHKAVAIFKQHKLRCCLFGSAACALYGASRCPNDVDLVVLDVASDPEDLKQLLVKGDDRFYTVSSKSPNAAYQVLWYRLSSTAGHAQRECKVDILIPGGDLGIPFVPDEYREIRHDLPVLPLLPLLMLKLQGWSDHRDSDRWDMQQKQYTDVEDVEDLLILACDQHLHTSLHSWLPQEFIDAAQDRVVDYVEEFPQSSLYWYSLGFTVD